MIQPVLQQHRIERDGAVLSRFLQGRLRIVNVSDVLERFEALQIVGRDDDGHRLAMSLDDDPLPAVLGAAQQVGKMVLGVSDSHSGHCQL
jgi:hypothetical protein